MFDYITLYYITLEETFVFQIYADVFIACIKNQNWIHLKENVLRSFKIVLNTIMLPLCYNFTLSTNAVLFKFGYYKFQRYVCYLNKSSSDHRR